MIQHVDHIISLLAEAGRRIMEVYDAGESAADVQWKEDNSPLTLADRRSHDFLCEALQLLDSNIPMMSEEAAQLSFEDRSAWTRYWCLDPLDGTKEFIKRNGQFTINLALMENANPILGFIHVPVTGETYWAVKGQGAHRYDGLKSERIQSNSKTADWIAVGSGSHGSAEELAVLENYPISETRKAGSALKFCLIARGDADVYYRHGPTMEWDTAAGHILVEEAGAYFEFIGDMKRNYNKESLLNPSFLVRINYTQQN
ncbi:MAG: 3'(2'),5'-bisphosphate nucleotidase CysQ [Flavobacteriales bacterium]|jgi:3'(2'), 5'-bisphosphate nucleotidase